MQSHIPQPDRMADKICYSGITQDSWDTKVQMPEPSTRLFTYCNSKFQLGCRSFTFRRQMWTVRLMVGRGIRHEPWRPVLLCSICSAQYSGLAAGCKARLSELGTQSQPYSASCKTLAFVLLPSEWSASLNSAQNLVHHYTMFCIQAIRL